MEAYVVKIYEDSLDEDWNDFLEKSNQDTFLFHRDFMSYHKILFQDYSLMIYHKNLLIALLPGNLKGGTFFSHEGLTYGGLIHLPHLSAQQLINCYRCILKFLHKKKIESLFIKELPSVYLKYSTVQILPYICFKTQAILEKVFIHSVINLNHLRLSKSRLSGIKRGKKHELLVKETSNLTDFWNKILIPNLQQKHQVLPVHSLQDITQLKNKFPKQIRQFNLYYNNEIMAGSTIFEMKNIVHSQYISANNHKNTLGTLDYLHYYLIENIFKDKTYFSFGNSHENDGQQINEGLIYWKEGFGATAISQSFYKINTASYTHLENIFI